MCMPTGQQNDKVIAVFARFCTYRVTQQALGLGWVDFDFSTYLARILSQSLIIPRIINWPGGTE